MFRRLLLFLAHFVTHHFGEVFYILFLRRLFEKNSLLVIGYISVFGSSILKTQFSTSVGEYMNLRQTWTKFAWENSQFFCKPELAVFWIPQNVFVEYSDRLGYLNKKRQPFSISFITKAKKKFSVETLFVGLIIGEISVLKIGERGKRGRYFTMAAIELTTRQYSWVGWPILCCLLTRPDQKHPWMKQNNGIITVTIELSLNL